MQGRGTGANSVPYPAVPEAVITGWRSSTLPTRTHVPIKRRFTDLFFIGGATLAVTSPAMLGDSPIPWAAANAALTVVTQLTPCRLAAFRICAPSLLPTEPRGVFTTNLIVPLAMRSTAVTVSPASASCTLPNTWSTCTPNPAR